MQQREEEIFRGEIYYVYPAGNVDSEQMAGRPAIVVSNDKANQHSSVLEMVYLTTRAKNSLPTHVDITSVERPSIALCEQIHSVAKSRIGTFITKCTDREMAMVDGALCVSLGLELPSVPEPKKPTIPEKVTPKVGVQESPTETSFWKGLYYDLLDKLVQARGA